MFAFLLRRPWIGKFGTILPFTDSQAELSRGAAVSQYVGHKHPANQVVLYFIFVPSANQVACCASYWNTNLVLYSMS